MDFLFAFNQRYEIIFSRDFIWILCIMVESFMLSISISLYLVLLSIDFNFSIIFDLGIVLLMFSLSFIVASKPSIHDSITYMFPKLSIWFFAGVVLIWLSNLH